MSSSRLAKHPRRRALAALAAGGALVLLLSGCTGGGEPTPTPSASTDAAEPIFATDEEALAAAVEAYEAYTSISDALSADPAMDAAAIESTVTERYAPEFIASLTEFRNAGLRTTGSIERHGFELAQQSSSSDNRADVQIYVCVDYSATDILNASGQAVTPPDRQTLTRSLVSLVSQSGGSPLLLVDSTELWDNSEGC